MAENDDVSLSVHINPLSFVEVDLPPPRGQGDVSPTDVLRYLCGPTTACDVAEIVARYKQINVEAPKIFVAPAEPRLLDRLIWPLRHAKGSFMVGNYLGTIALCGMVAEMVAILVFDVADKRVNGVVPLDDALQDLLLGRRFERLGQERRVDVLRAFGMINDSHHRDFNAIRTARNRYLHLWSADHASSQQDAITCFKAAARLVVSSLGLGVSDGKVVLRREIYDYLRAHEPTASASP